MKTGLPASPSEDYGCQLMNATNRRARRGFESADVRRRQSSQMESDASKTDMFSGIYSSVEIVIVSGPPLSYSTMAALRKEFFVPAATGGLET